MTALLATNNAGFLVILDAGGPKDSYQATVDANGNAYLLPRGRYRLVITADAGAPIFFGFLAGTPNPMTSPRIPTTWRVGFDGICATIQCPTEFVHTQAGKQMVWGFVDPADAARYVIAALTLLDDQV